MLKEKVAYKPYQAKDYSHLKGLNGISDETMEIHFGLYNGYVNKYI